MCRVDFQNAAGFKRLPVFKTLRLLLLLATASSLVAACGQEKVSVNGSPSGQTDSIAPSPPTGLVGTAMGSSGASLSWTAATDNVAVTSYVVSRNGALITNSRTTSYIDTGLAPATTYSYSVAAVDGAGNLSANSASVSVTTAPAVPPADTTAPTQPAGFAAVAASSSLVNLSWSASTDNVGVTGYIVTRNGVQIATPTATTFADSGRTPATSYAYTVAARDAAGNRSTAASASVTTPAAVTKTVDLSWDPVTAPNLSGYRIYYGTASRTYTQMLSAGNTTIFPVSGLLSGTRYFFAVTAIDSLGNESGPSNEVFTDIP